FRRRSVERTCPPGPAQVVRGPLAQLPVPGSQRWHVGHPSGVPVHVPPAHASPVVHALPSLHGFVLAVKTQPDAGAHASSVQGLPSLQTSGTPPLHEPFAGLQVSTPLQALPSLHTIGVPCAQSWSGPQVSTPLHGFRSSQSADVVQTLPHALPSASAGYCPSDVAAAQWPGK